MGQASDSETFPLFLHLAENYKLALESLVTVAATRNKHDTMFLIIVVDAYLPIPTLFIIVILVFHLSFSNVSFIFKTISSVYSTPIQLVELSGWNSASIGSTAILKFITSYSNTQSLNLHNYEPVEHNFIKVSVLWICALQFYMQISMSISQLSW